MENGHLQDIVKSLSALNSSWKCPALDDKKKESLLDSTLFSLGFDWKYITMIKQGIKDNPKIVLQTVLSYLKGSGWVSKDMMPMAQMTVNYLTDNPEYLDYLITGIDYAENFFESESGKRIVKLIPRLMTASTEEALELFTREADYNQEAFFNLMANGDVAETFLRQVARFFIKCFAYAKQALDDDLKFAIMNGMLISNKFPPVNRKNLLKSSVDILEKLIRTFTVYRAETNLYQQIKVVTDEFEKLYFRFDDLEKLSEKEVEHVMGRFLEENVFGAMKDAWLVHRQVTVVDERCAPQLACLYNANYRSSNEIVRAVVRGFTTSMSWSWTAAFTAEEGVDPEQLEEAKTRGQDMNASCDQFKPKRLGPEDRPLAECDVLKEQKQKLQMNLSYEHNEL